MAMYSLYVQKILLKLDQRTNQDIVNTVVIDSAAIKFCDCKFKELISYWYHFLFFGRSIFCI